MKNFIICFLSIVMLCNLTIFAKENDNNNADKNIVSIIGKEKYSDKTIFNYAEDYLRKNQENIIDNAKAGAMTGVAAFLILILKDYYFGVLVPGGPTFGPFMGAFVVGFLSICMVTSLGAYLDVNFLHLE